MKKRLLPLLLSLVLSLSLQGCTPSPPAASPAPDSTFPVAIPSPSSTPGDDVGEQLTEAMIVASWNGGILPDWYSESQEEMTIEHRLKVAMIVAAAEGRGVEVVSPESPPEETPAPEPSNASSLPTWEELQEQNAAQDPVSVTVYITNTGSKYHSYGCQYLSKSCIPVDLDDAKSGGYGPCSKCHPPT